MGLSTESCNSGAVVLPAGKNKWQPQGYHDTKVQVKTDDLKCARCWNSNLSAVEKGSHQQHQQRSDVLNLSSGGLFKMKWP